LTTDGEEYYSYARSRQQDQQIQEQQLQQDQQHETTQQQQETGDSQDNKNARVPAAAVTWSPDSKRFTLIRRDERQIKDLCVINALSSPRPTLETYRYAMPGEENIGARQMFVFDIAKKKQMAINADRF